MATVGFQLFHRRDTTHPPRMLSTMKIWSWIVEANPANLAELKQLALTAATG